MVCCPEVLSQKNAQKDRRRLAVDASYITGQSVRVNGGITREINISNLPFYDR